MRMDRPIPETAVEAALESTGSPPKVGLALSCGAARGWAHIGVLEVLDANGIVPDIVCGCSMGSLVGAAYVLGELDQLRDWALSLTWREIIGLLDPSFSGGGLLRGERLLRFLRENYRDIDIKQTPIPFGAVATDLANGREVWLREGNLFDAVHASIAVPGLLGPAQRDGRWLVDGGLVNPVPVSLCRAMGADVVIAVNVNTEMPPLTEPPKNGGNGWPLAADLTTKLRGLFGNETNGDSEAEPTAAPLARPSTLGAVSNALFIMQDVIARGRLAGDPPHLTLAPRLARTGVQEFDHAKEAIDEGRRCAEAMLPAIRDAVGR
jgi:NTE family protein